MHLSARNARYYPVSILLLWIVLASVLASITGRIRDWNVMTDELVWERFKDLAVVRSTVPAVGAAMAELILSGRSTTVDIKPFGFERILKGHPIRTENEYKMGAGFGHSL